ncbi:MAG: TolC family protein, partial [Pseudomonadota bacterium]
EGSLDQTVVLKERAVQLEEAASEARNALRIVNLRYEEGETDLLDVLTIQQRVLSNEGDVVSIERAQLDEWVGLNLALGGSWEEGG